MQQLGGLSMSCPELAAGPGQGYLEHNKTHGARFAGLKFSVCWSPCCVVGSLQTTGKGQTASNLPPGHSWALLLHLLLVILVPDGPQEADGRMWGGGAWVQGMG